MKQGELHYRVARDLRVPPEDRKPFLASFVFEKVLAHAEGGDREAGYSLSAVQTRPLEPGKPAPILIEETKTFTDSQGAGYKESACWVLQDPTPELVACLGSPHVMTVSFLRALGWLPEMSKRI